MARFFTHHDFSHDNTKGSVYATVLTEKSWRTPEGVLIKPDASLHLSSGPMILIDRKQAASLLRRAKEMGSKIETRWQTY